MKILVIGDPHFKSNNEIESNMMCDKIYEILLTEKPMYVVCLGDILDTHGIIHMDPYKRAINFLHRVSQLTTHLFIIIGNHDRNNNTVYLTEESPFIPCKNWKNTTVVDRVVIHDGFVFVPYVPNGRFFEALSTVNITPENIRNYKTIFAHQEFKNCKMGAIISVNGDEYAPDYPLCISGHIHDFQILQNNLVYPGTPFQLGYGVPPSKGVMMLTIENSFSTPETSTQDFSGVETFYEFIDLGLPKKMIVHITPEELAKYVVPPNCFVKLVCKGDTKVIREITKLESVKEMLKNTRVKLSIQEDRSKTFNSTLPVASRMETIPFQKRLLNAIESSDDNVKSIFTGIFGSLKV